MDNHNKDDSSSSSSPIPPSASSRSPASAVAPPPVFPKRYLIIIAIIVAVAILILFTVRYTTGTFNPFFVVASDSMVPTLQVRDLLIMQHPAASDVDSPASYENLKIGDIILFKNPHVLREDTREPMTIVHRLAQINTTTTTTTTTSF
jgi:signal peptidase I